MDYPIIDLMHTCVVKLVAPTPGSIGSGFFVAPGLILTCAHVVGDLNTKKHCKRGIQVRWKEHEKFATAEVKEWKPDLDIALLAYATDQALIPPCVLFGKVCLTGHELATFGYRRDFPNGDPATFTCKGYTGDDPPFIRFKLDNVKGGMSGSPILDLETKRVCGMVKFTVDTRTPEGGGGIWADTILKHFKELEQLQEQHHQQDPRWYTAIGAKTPGVFLDLVQNNIAERLEDPSLETLKNCLGNILKKKRGLKVRSAADIALKLVEIDTNDTLLLLFLAWKNTVAELDKNRASEATKQYIRSAVYDILGWLVLLAVDVDWMAKNRDELYPEQFPGSIELPVKRADGIEIIHASLNKRCARFDLDKGTLYGPYRIPSVDHEQFLESGISTAETVNEIKRSIYIYLSKYWGKDKIPDHFNQDHNEELNAQLEWFNGANEGRYLVVKRSEDDCPLNCEVYKMLKSDLPALQVIFHNTSKQGTAFTVSEITLSSNIRNFLLTE